MTALQSNPVLITGVLFLFGLAVGSFINVLVLRLNTGMTMRGRSRCFSCLERLKWHDLIPLVSYISIRGRCRYCRSKISLQYPVVELLTGVIFATLAYVAGPIPLVPVDFQSTLSFFEIARYSLAALFFTTLLALSVYDIRHKIIPNQLSGALLVFAILYELNTMRVFLDSETLKLDLFSALGAFLFFAGLWFISRGRWMGFGDARIALPIGLFLGYQWTIFAIFFSFWSGAIIGIILLLFKKYTRRSEVPFAPFLAFGAFLAYLLAATNILAWYYHTMVL